MSENNSDLTFDVLIIGGGPAGLAAAIRLKQLSENLSVCVLEKGSEIGAHILSGMILEPSSLDELLPTWREKEAPLTVKVTEEQFVFLNKNRNWVIPHWFLPPELNNKDHYVGSLGYLCQWLAQTATALGVEIFPGFAGAEILWDARDDRVKGVKTGDKGVAKEGSHKPEYQPGVQIEAKYTLLAEGCRGFLSEKVIQHYHLREKCDPQTYGMGIKEIWQVQPKQHHPGLVQHFVGWPLPKNVYGGSFIYHLDNLQVAVGLVMALDYRNPYLDPFAEMQQFKTHPNISPLFNDAKRIAYGARAINEGGWQSIPQLIFPGGALIGCSAGFLNVAKIKGVHNAMKTGMLAAEAIVQSLQEEPAGRKLLSCYPELLQKSQVYQELYTVRNFRKYFHFGLWPGIVLGGLDLKICRGKLPWTLHQKKEDRAQTGFANEYEKIHYPLPDGKITFDRISSLYLANLVVTENQPNHLILRDPNKSIDISYQHYAAPEQRYCPAGVYEILFNGEKQPKLHINAANCIHCKTCAIKDPAHNIEWVVPEGGSGPDYQGM